ncbi:MAG: single-stranded DNA-binding protein [Candidatus Improbicoccus devescovinae]|nr:MAG: single-stranded DNA-binding protein [Candidatus Improbicoccus devescovinae]
MLNVVAFVGRLTANPELRHTTSDIAMCRFSIAVSRSFVKQGEDRQTDFFDVVTWRSTAEFVCNHFGKGQLIGVDGSMQTRSYVDANGVKRKVYDIIANNVHFVESKNSNNADPIPEDAAENSGSSYTSGGASSFSGGNTEDQDDLPF